MKYIDADRLRARIEKYLTFDNSIDTAFYIGRRDAERSILDLIDSLQQEQPDFPTTDEQVKEFLATHPKTEVPEKYKSPDWLFKNQEQQELPKIERAEYYYHKGLYEGLSQGRADALKILDELMKRKADPVIVIKQQDHPEVDLESFVKTYFKVKRLDEMKLTTSGDVLLNFAKQVSRIAASAAFANCELTPENTVSQNIDQEIENTIKLNDLWDLLPNTLIKYTANHFYGLRNRALEEAARRVYESWMGGTMDDVRRDMVELGKVLYAEKEGNK